MKRFLLYGGAALLLVLLAGVLIIANLDWNRARPWVNARLSSAIGRPFSIDGNLSITWQKSARPEPGWRGWLPQPQVTAGDVHIASPSWHGALPDMAHVGQLDFSFDLLPLLAKNLSVSTLSLTDPKLTLERRADGKNNWTFFSGGPLEWGVEIRTLVLSRGSMRLVDAIRHADLTLNVNTLPATQAGPYGTDWKLSGKYNNEPIRGHGRAGAVLSLQSESAPFPIEASVQAGRTSIDLKGTLTRPRELAALEMRLKLSGASMAQLFPLIGVPLPETPSYVTEGHLSGLLNALGGDWAYDKFSGKMGSSDLAGTLSFKSRRPRPLLQGEITSNLLNFSDLAPAIGAGSRRSKAERGVADTQPAGKILPAEPFKTDRWRSVDVDVKFTGRRIVREKALPIDNLFARIKIDDGVLSLQPLDFGVAGGALKTSVRLDGRGTPVKADMKLSARGLNLKDLFPAVPSMHASLGAINGDATLTATGNSIAQLLGSSNGEVKSSISGGTISKLLLDEIGLNLGNVILTRILGDKEIQLRCARGDFSITEGVMQTRPVVIDTDRSVITVDGRIDLAKEQLDLTLKPVSKSLRLISFNGPLYVTGSFDAPNVDVDKGRIALKAAGAIALAVLAPVAALIPLTTMGHAEEGDCRIAPGVSRTGSPAR